MRPPSRARPSAISRGRVRREREPQRGAVRRPGEERVARHEGDVAARARASAAAAASMPPGSRAQTNMPPSGRLWVEPGGSACGEAVEQGVAARAVLRAQAGEVGVEVDGGEPQRGGGLVDGRGVQVGGLLRDDERAAQRPAAYGPSRSAGRARRPSTASTARACGPRRRGAWRGSAAARRGSAARRTGRPRAATGRRARRPRRALAAARAAACGRSGCGRSGPCRARVAPCSAAAAATASGSSPSSSHATGTGTAPASANACSAARYDGSSTSTRSPGSSSTAAASVSACWEPLVTSSVVGLGRQAARSQPRRDRGAQVAGRPRWSSTAARGRRARRTARRRTRRAARRRRTARARAGRRRTRSCPGGLGQREDLAHRRARHPAQARGDRREVGRKGENGHFGLLEVGGIQRATTAARGRRASYTAAARPTRSTRHTLREAGLDVTPSRIRWASQRFQKEHLTLPQLLTEDDQNPSAARQNLKADEFRRRPFGQVPSRGGEEKWVRLCSYPSGLRAARRRLE